MTEFDQIKDYILALMTDPDASEDDRAEAADLADSLTEVAV